MFMIVYIDDLVVYLKQEEDYKEHICLVLKALIDVGLYCKLSKCIFSTKEVELLGYIILDKGISMSNSRLRTILD